jgi:hypothetical protein
VTDDQIPPLKELLHHPKIIIIDHKQIIPAKFLPVFFSDVIESYLHNIPNLTEIFLYNNDDFFFFRYIDPRDLFSIDNGKLNIKIINDFHLERTKAHTTEYSIRLIYTTKVLGGNYFINNHATKILRTSTLKYLEKTYPKKLEALRSFRFRTADCIQYLFFAMNIDHRLHRNIILPKTDINYACYDFHGPYHEKYKKRFIYKKIKFVCYNSMDGSYKKIFEQLMQHVLQ